MGLQPKWLEYAKRLQAIAQSGLAYSKDKYDIERFQEIRDISVDIMHQYTNIDHKKIKDLFAGETGYQTPKIDVRGAIFKDEKIVLIKETIDGLWAMPGGWADIDLSLKENIIKEAYEEAGAKIIPTRIIAIQDRGKHNIPPAPFSIYKIFIQCNLLEIKFQKNIETSKVGFFELDHLPPLSIGRTTKEQIEMCFNMKDKEVHQTIFD